MTQANRRTTLAGILGAIVSGCQQSGAQTGGTAAPVARRTVVLTCVAEEDGTNSSKRFKITFDLAQGRWTQLEDGGTSEVLRTKSGKSVQSAGTTYLKKEDPLGPNVAKLDGFSAATSPMNAHRSDGNAGETGRTFEWTVTAIT